MYVNENYWLHVYFNPARLFTTLKKSSLHVYSNPARLFKYSEKIQPAHLLDPARLLKIMTKSSLHDYFICTFIRYLRVLPPYRIPILCYLLIYLQFFVVTFPDLMQIQSIKIVAKQGKSIRSNEIPITYKC